MCYNKYMKKIFLLIILNLFVFAPVCLAANTANPASAPLILGGNFSAQTTPSAQAQIFDKQARDREVELLSEKLRQKQYNDVINRINTLTAKNWVDDRFYLLLALAFDGIDKTDDVIYSASQALAVAPQDARAYMLRASAYLKQKNYERAQIDVDTALKLNPTSTLANKLKKQLDAHTAQVRGNSQKAREPIFSKGLVLYIGLILLGVFVFVYFRYEDLFQRKKSAHSRKETEIKDQYDFIRQIGEGGMGKVYEAYDKALKRKVAIKRVRPELVRSSYVREQFLSEARMVALLRHPYIVEIYTVIETENSLYLVFEYVDGQTLETRLDIDGRLPFSQVKQIFQHVCEALQYAHSQDIIHCDLKPGNIMILEDNKAKVMDFGVAKKVDNQTGARTVAGTPAYMAPEQQRGFMRKQSDVYSLALCVYEALVGQVPWTVKGFDIAKKKIVPAYKLAPNVPPAVDAVLEDALKEEPSERIQSIQEFWERLSAIEPLKDDRPEITHY